MATDDTFLLQRWIDERDGDAFNELVSRHAAMVYSVCRRVLRHSADAEDVTQDCFLKLAHSRSVPVSSFASWLHSMATHVAIDHVRREARRRAVERRFAVESPLKRQDWSEVESYVDEAIDELPIGLRDVIIAHFIQRRTHSEIARELGVTRQSVSYRIRKGIETVRDSLARKRILQVSVGMLTSLFSSELVEAAPSPLMASLGKIALADVPVRSTTLASSAGTWARVGGVFMGKKTSATLLAAVWLIATGYVGYLRPWKSEKVPSYGDTLTAPPSQYTGIEEPKQNSPSESVIQGKDERRPRTAIAGIVRDAKTGDPVARARIRLGDIDSATDAKGAYRLESVEERDGRVSVSAEGYVTVDREITAGAVAVPEVRLDFDIDRQLTILCVNRDGIPEEGVDVYVATADRIDLQRINVYGPRTTGRDGIVRFEEIVHYRGKDSPRWIYAAMKGQAAALRREDFNSTRAGTDYPIRLTLHQTMQVAGVVIVPDELDARDVTVSVVRLGGNEHFIERYEGRGRDLWPSLFEVHPDLDGRFSIGGLPAGTGVVLVAEAAGLGRRGFESSNPTLLRKIELRLSPEVEIEGTLRYLDTGAPAAGVPLAASPREVFVGFSGNLLTEVDASGHFRFQGLAPVPYAITLADSFDRSDWTMKVFGPVRGRSGESISGVELFLEQGGIVSGVVYDASTQQPVRGVDVRGTAGRSGQTVVAKATTNEDGFYELRVPTGRSSIRARSVPEGYQWSSVKHSVEVAVQGEQINNLDFQLLPTEENDSAAAADAIDERMTVQGTVVRTDGRAVEGALVIIRNLREDRWAGRDFTDANGSYEFSVPPGRGYKVRAQGKRISTVWSEEFDVFSGATEQLDDLIVREGNSFVGGWVVDSQSHPVEGALLIASSESKRPELVKTDKGGRFRVEHLLSDEVVHLAVDNYDFEFQDFLVSPGTSNVRLVIHRIDREVKTDVARKVPLKKAEMMVGQVAPPWAVGEWIRQPYDPIDPVQRDGQHTVLVYTWLPQEKSKFSTFFDGLEKLERACMDAEAIPVLIVAHQAHASVIRPEIERRSLSLAVGIDRFLPRSKCLHSSNATMIAYGGGRWPVVFVIDPRGIIREVQSGLDGVDALLTRW